MIMFYVATILLIGIALLFVLPTLLRKDRVPDNRSPSAELNLMVLRDQLSELDADLIVGTIDAASHETSKTDLERRTIEDVQPDSETTEFKKNKYIVAIGIAVLFPLFTGILYYLIGSPNAMNESHLLAETKINMQVSTDDQISIMVVGLVKRLKEMPDDADGWDMLARSYHTLRRYTDAADAYSHVVKLVPDDAALLADYADTLAMSLNRSLQGEPEKLVIRALIADPKNIKALALAGSAAFERKDYQLAASYWKKILPLVPVDSETAKSTLSNVNEAESLSGKSPRQLTSDGSEEKSEATRSKEVFSDVSVEGTVELDSSLRSKVSQEDTVFIFARASDGPRFPLAVLRKKVKDLPTIFTLDDSMSMLPEAKLSGFPVLIVGARISKSGSATPSAGDLEGIIESVRPGARGLKIRISSERK